MDIKISAGKAAGQANKKPAPGDAGAGGPADAGLGKLGLPGEIIPNSNGKRKT